MKKVALLGIVAVLGLTACAPQAQPAADFRIIDLILPTTIPYGQVGSGRIFYQGAPAFPLTVTVNNVACSVADRCRNFQFTVSEDVVRNNSFVFRYRCEAEGRRTLETADDLILTDANGVSTQRMRYFVRCVP